MKNILDLNFSEAKEFFLKEESYCNFDLPKYFTFEAIFNKINDYINEKKNRTISNCQSGKPCDFENINYKLFKNKDGKFAWRCLELIHPAIYLSLVNSITEENNWKEIIKRFEDFRKSTSIECCSMPAVSENGQTNKAATVTNWWQSIEQRSIELALEYKYTLQTDISDCYSSIYTHSVAWAIHTKPEAKTKRGFQLIGNKIDKHLQDMSYGQTNGIPQGSVLMDFIAEIVLGYADEELFSRINKENIENYKIIRYRDDYRIFSNNPQELEIIIKLLTEVLIDLGLKLNTQKTFTSDNIVRDSIKADKLYWISAKQKAENIQSQLLLIHQLSEKYPNSGSLNRALTDFFENIQKSPKKITATKVLISILVDIIYKNPRVYPISTAILSFLLSITSSEEVSTILKNTKEKLSLCPNNEHFKIWLQRIIIKVNDNQEYDVNLCKKVTNSDTPIWESSWLNQPLKRIVDSTSIINQEEIDKMDLILTKEEIELFKENSIYQ